MGISANRLSIEEIYVKPMAVHNRLTIAPFLREIVPEPALS
jgi:hypothetical protein